MAVVGYHAAKPTLDCQSGFFWDHTTSSRHRWTHIKLASCPQVLGDSLMRQLFSRLVHMMRGHSRVVDYKMHTHDSYSVCQVPCAHSPAALDAVRPPDDPTTTASAITPRRLDVDVARCTLRFGAGLSS
jgi:hypothetical protein